MSEKLEQKYAYFVEHPKKGGRIFYDPYNTDNSAKKAIDFASNETTVYKLPLEDSPFETPSVRGLSVQFTAAPKPELPDLSPLVAEYEGLVPSMG